MRENQIIPKEPWTLEQYKARILTVEKKIAEESQEINTIRSQINMLTERKKHLQLSISKKSKYINLLTENLFDHIPTVPDKQIEENRLQQEKINDDSGTESQTEHRNEDQ